MTKTTTRDYTRKWQPQGAPCDLVLGLFVLGINQGESGRDSAVGESRLIRQ
jgi:hypothetical protein